MVEIDKIRAEFAKRLHEACELAGVRERGRAVDIQKSLKALTVHASTTAIGKWLNGDSLPEPDKLLPLADWLKVRPEWLEYGRGEMREAQQSPGFTGVAEPEITYRNFDLEDDPSYVGVTQLSARAAAGAGADNSHVEIRGVLAFKSDWLRANQLNPKGLDVIYAEGDSMDPTINSGDVLLVDRSKFEPRDGQIFALQSESNGTIVKRLVKSEIDGWIIRSDNPRYRDETLRDGEINEVRIIGRVVWRGGML